MEVSGKIHFIGVTTQVTDSYKKRELVVKTDEQYPQLILIEFAQDKCDLLNNFQKGQNVTVGINLNGREWVNPQGETKYFNSIRGWKINADSQASAQAPQAPSFEPATDINNQEHDDLPF